MVELITIRGANEDEAAAMSSLAIRSKAHWGYSNELMEAFRDELIVSAADIRAETFHYVVAQTGTTLAGYYALEQKSDTEYELEAMFVEPDYIGMGIGRALLSHARNAVSVWGGKKILIQSDPHAEDFYRAAGAEVIGDRESGSITGRLLPLLCINLD